MDIPLLHSRAADTNKSDCGRVFVLAGSMGMVGAAFLAAQGALRSGAGYVRLGMPWRLAALAPSNAAMICVMTTSLPETEEGTLGLMAKQKILDACEGYDVTVVGPGLSMNAQTQQMLTQLLPEMECSLVLDADALNCIAKHPEILPKLSRERGLPILTPHPGEFARLAGLARPPLEYPLRQQACRDFAKKHNVVCVLKGARTVVSDGQKVYENTTGNPGMATAGTGDVLAGMVGALRAQGYDSFDAAVLAVYLHGLAGDISESQLGVWGMTARDVIEALPQAFMRHFKEHQ